MFERSISKLWFSHGNWRTLFESSEFSFFVSVRETVEFTNNVMNFRFRTSYNLAKRGIDFCSHLNTAVNFGSKRKIFFFSLNNLHSQHKLAHIVESEVHLIQKYVGSTIYFYPLCNEMIVSFSVARFFSLQIFQYVLIVSKILIFLFLSSIQTIATIVRCLQAILILVNSH